MMLWISLLVVVFAISFLNLFCSDKSEAPVLSEFFIEPSNFILFEVHA